MTTTPDRYDGLTYEEGQALAERDEADSHLPWICEVCEFETPTEAAYQLHWDLAVTADLDRATSDAGEGAELAPISPNRHPHAYAHVVAELAAIDERIGDASFTAGHTPRCRECGCEDTRLDARSICDHCNGLTNDPPLYF